MKDPYQIEKDEVFELKDNKPLFWSKMLIVGVIYTLLGIGFVVCCFFYRDQILGGNSDLFGVIQLMEVLVWGALVFIVSGVTAIVICLIMRGKERQLRWELEQQSPSE